MVTSKNPLPSRLLPREKWREAVLKRDNTTCVLCGGPATEVHHIMERRLFSDGGYYLDNGVSVCDQGCHLRCEFSEVTCEELRTLAGVTTVVLPEGLSPLLVYDKWGNYLTEGVWRPGPLFHEESVQRVLRRTHRLHTFVTT